MGTQACAPAKAVITAEITARGQTPCQTTGAAGSPNQGTVRLGCALRLWPGQRLATLADDEDCSCHAAHLGDTRQEVYNDTLLARTVVSRLWAPAAGRPCASRRTHCSGLSGLLSCSRGPSLSPASTGVPLRLTRLVLPARLLQAGALVGRSSRTADRDRLTTHSYYREVSFPAHTLWLFVVAAARSSSAPHGIAYRPSLA